MATESSLAGITYLALCSRAEAQAEFESSLKSENQQDDLALKDASDALTLADTSALEKQARLIRCQILSETNFFYLSDIWNEDLSWLKDHTSGKELTEVLTLELHKISENNYLFEGHTEYVLSLLDKITELGHEDVNVQIKRIEAYFGAYNYGLALAATDRALSMTNDRDKILDVLSLRA